MFVSVWPFDKKRRGRKVILGSLTSIQRHRRRIASDMVQICHSPKHSCCWLLPHAVIHHCPQEMSLEMHPFLCEDLSKSLQSILTKLSLKCSHAVAQTIYCSQFKVFVLIDACYHWKPFKELLISATSTSAPFPRPNCKALCVTTTSTTSAHPLLLGGDQGDNVTLQKSQPGVGPETQRSHMSTHVHTPF